MDVAEKPWLPSRAWKWVRLKRPSLAASLLAAASIVFLSLLQRNSTPAGAPYSPPTTTVAAYSASLPANRSCAGFYDAGPPRKAVFSIKEFGGIGDGRTSNTAAFRRAVERCREFGDKGGAQLNVPPGRWLTGSFNLSSNFTLFLDDGAVILGSEDPKEWPLIEPLPSYGRGRERPGGRHISLIHGNGLHDVVLTGHNGSIDGQGKIWWDLWWNRTLEHTRGHLVELVNSTNILISNLTFLNAPFWTIHPVYCSNAVIKNLTVLAPLHSPNTDGIDPDSSTNICIEDCYIESGDDLVAVKSGWDQYGVAVARPSSNIIIQRISGTTPTCSGVGIGSEMSGGISNILVDDLHVWDSAAAVRIKTDRGRGGYITNVTITNVKMERVKVPIRFSQGSDDHPDEGWDRNALPQVNIIHVSNVTSIDAEKAPILEGIEGAKFEGLCLRNINLGTIRHETKWRCEHIDGEAYNVFPPPCPQLRSNATSSKCLH
ncbi:probable polygalacturonase [Dendrobium catenatum]|uniref:Putative polygalacturonase n=1 Tax=Dendrobium catenatum TaxID=906689 RepID=A0A2I0VTE4_9ASPA|nr:probable polygalacturonase [Dendrobium catenatum]XP_020676174.1 probable polygalacturonase [Dendrobium catenatum]PKU66682.1 putative polygalacturonase [Dendrobium catenatum]